MTHCKDFWKKLEKDDDFCGMGAAAYRRAVAYTEYCDSHNIVIGSISQGEWRKRVTERRRLDSESEPVEKDKKAIAISNDGEAVLGVLNPDYVRPEDSDCCNIDVSPEETARIHEQMAKGNKASEPVEQDTDGTPEARALRETYPEDLVNREMEIYLDIKVLLGAVEDRIAKLETTDKKIQIMSEMAAIVKRVNK